MTKQLTSLVEKWGRHRRPATENASAPQHLEVLKDVLVKDIEFLEVQRPKTVSTTLPITRWEKIVRSFSRYKFATEHRGRGGTVLSASFLGGDLKLFLVVPESNLRVNGKLQFGKERSIVFPPGDDVDVLLMGFHYQSEFGELGDFLGRGKNSDSFAASASDLLRDLPREFVSFVKKWDIWKRWGNRKNPEGIKFPDPAADFFSGKSAISSDDFLEVLRREKRYLVVKDTRDGWVLGNDRENDVFRIDLDEEGWNPDADADYSDGDWAEGFEDPDDPNEDEMEWVEEYVKFGIDTVDGESFRPDDMSFDGDELTLQVEVDGGNWVQPYMFTVTGLSYLPDPEDESSRVRFVPVGNGKTWKRV